MGISAASVIAVVPPGARTSGTHAPQPESPRAGRTAARAVPGVPALLQHGRIGRRHQCHQEHRERREEQTIEQAAPEPVAAAPPVAGDGCRRQYVDRQQDIRKPLKAVIEADVEFQAKLRALGDSNVRQFERRERAGYGDGWYDHRHG